MSQHTIDPNSSVRAALLAALDRDVRLLVSLDRDDALQCVLESIGYSSIWNAHTSADIGRAIDALVPLIEIDHLASVVHCAAFQAAYDGVTTVADIDEARRAAHCETADRAADGTLAKVGADVLARFLVRIARVAGAAS